MSAWRADPERAATDLIANATEALAFPAPGPRCILVVDAPRLPPILTAAGLLAPGDTTVTWSRRSPHAHPATAPGFTHFGAAFLRLPKDKDELEASAHVAMARLAVAAPLYVFGGNDEGIKSAARRLVSLHVQFETVSTRGHGRIIVGRGTTGLSLRGEMGDWRRVVSVDLGIGGSRPWVSYPGSFAGGGLDTGTALLLRHLPAIPLDAPPRVLDFACGTGVIARALLDRTQALQVDLCDLDAWTLAAAKENVPEAVTAFPSLTEAPAGRRYQAIIANPPYHDGFREDQTVLQDLIKRAPALLTRTGRLTLVVQRRIDLAAKLKARFAKVEILADDGRFRVWTADQRA